MEVTYKQGATVVWSDGEKIIITNPTGTQYIKDNVDRIFGMGTYDKIIETKYYINITPGKINPNAKEVEICGGFIPKRVELDLQKQRTSGTSKEDYSKFFKREEE